MPTLEERKTANRELAVAICEHLPGWSHYDRPGYEGHDSAYMRHTETGRMLFFREPRDGKLTIEPTWVQREGRNSYETQWYMPHEYARSGCPQQGSITVSLTRGPVAIARDIQRRLLPGMFAACEWLEAKMRRDTEFADAAAATLDRMARICGQAPPLHPNHYRSGALSPRFPAEVFGQVKVDGADSVSLELRSMPADLAAKVLDLVMNA